MSAEFLTTPGDRLLTSRSAHSVSIIARFRAVLRSFGFGLALAAAALDFAREAAMSRGVERVRRARWLHRWCRAFAWVIGLRLQGCGTPPRSGMIVSNHLSYLDIVALSALAPCVFVAKNEVANWPVFGWFARRSGTIFVDRRSRMKVAETNAAIGSALRAGVLVVLFAEGTSSGGHDVLPFRSSLLDSVLQANVTITPTAIAYDVDRGSVPDEVCYWGEMTLLPHLFKLLGKCAVDARIAFGALQRRRLPHSRKEAAAYLHNAVAALHAAL